MPIILMLVVIVLDTLFVFGEDCPYKECDCYDADIYCGYKSLPALPQIMPYNNTVTWTLYLDGNLFTTIPSGSLPANLSTLSLESTPIETIDDTAFDDSIYTLQEVSFSQARFTQLPKAVRNLKALTTLTIDQTNINNWTDDTMNQLGSTIQSLFLTTVGLTSWPKWMNSMTNLSTLTITGCSILTITDNSLDKMVNTLTALNFASNGLTTLPTSMSNLNVINTLNLYNNSLTDVSLLPHSKLLTSIYINFNKIADAQQLSDALKSVASSLINYNIEYNSLSSIPDFSSLSLITWADLSYNHISAGYTGSFPANTTGVNIGNNLLSSIPSIVTNYKYLTSLSLNNNIIQTVQGSLIPTSVTSLDLSWNSISQLTKSSFPVNSSLNYLSINNNPLAMISTDAFDNVGELVSIIAEGTKLTRVPLALGSLPKLTYLDISNSTYLVCTCQEQSLYSWAKSLPSYGIYGNCGVISVYQFFVVLSKGCPPMLL